MKYGLITIDTPHANRGNRLIEHAVRLSLNLPAAHYVAPMFSRLTGADIEQFNRCDFVLLPGATILADAPGQGEALADIYKIDVPVFAVACGGWEPMPYQERAMSYITGPIGVRDPRSLDACRRLGLDAMLVGCPTAYYPKRERSDGPTIFGFARTRWNWQKKILAEFCEGGAIAACQEAWPVSHENEIIDALGIDSFKYGDPEDVIRRYAACRVVVTGRLHGLLPAMSQGATVAFFGDRHDSRFSLIEALGVPVWPVGEGSGHDLAFTGASTYGPKIEAMKAVFNDWKSLTVDRFRGNE